MSGRDLCYEIQFCGIDAFVLRVREMDRPGLPASIVFSATSANWQRVRTIVASFESEHVKDLYIRPPQMGEAGPCGFAIARKLS
jgi:hypothetical protein